MRNIINKILFVVRKQHSGTFWGVVFLYILSTGNVNGQNNFSVTAGWGKYELTNIGVQWNFKENYSLGVFSGTNFGLDNTFS